MSKPKTTNGFAAPDLRTVASDADDSADGSRMDSKEIVCAKPLNFNGSENADGADANHPPQSVREKSGTSSGRARQ
jgi:hypothetical protein